MDGMFERFTQQARQVVVHAQVEAKGLAHSHIGTTHLLLGLLHDRATIPVLVLDPLGVELDGVREAARERIPPAAGVTARSLPFSPHAKKVLEHSLREALLFNHNDIGPEDLLLGLLRVPESTAARILQAASVDLAQLRRDVVAALDLRPGAGPHR
jgi:ATP-dependent Clp protease ATP-binding subunit ClpC